MGTTACALKSADVLAGVLMESIDRVVELYVYNSETDLVRVVGLLPTYSWGDHNSLLGAEVGTGYLHRLPTSCRDTIGQSIERKVQVINGDGGTSEWNQATVQMEPHLEMEVDEDEEDVGIRTAASTKQPHQLGRPDRDIMAGSLETQESMRSISLVSEAGGEIYEQQAPLEAEADSEPTPPQRIAQLGGEETKRISKESKEDATEQSSQAPSAVPPFPVAAPVIANNVPPPPPPIAMPVHPPPLPPPQMSSAPPPPPPPPVPTKPMTSEFDQNPPSHSPQPTVPHNEGNEESEPDHEEESEEEDSEGEYETDSEEEEEEEGSPKKGGFFSSFMRAPPKMQY